MRSETASLSWVLYDFGGRSAALRNAKELLAAAQATQQAELQTVFASTAKDYYAAQAAAGSSLAARQIEAFSKNSFVAASQRVTRGIAPLSDELQAQTAYVQAVINHTRADAELRSAIGMLAVDLDLSPDTSIGLPNVEDGVEANTDFTQSVSELILEAKTHSPAVIAAEAQFRAAEAKADEVRAGGRPSISYVTKYSRNNQPASLGLGVLNIPRRDMTSTWGSKSAFRSLRVCSVLSSQTSRVPDRGRPGKCRRCAQSRGVKNFGPHITNCPPQPRILVIARLCWRWQGKRSKLPSIGTLQALVASLNYLPRNRRWRRQSDNVFKH